MEETPHIMENREFVDLEDEDIKQLNWTEAKKFEQNPEIKQVMARIEEESSSPGRWEEHWLTIDNNGRRVYSRIYYTADQGVAVTADGRIVRELKYPRQDEKQLH